MATLKNSKVLHFAMFPWFAMGHMTPYLHLSNELAHRGHRVSFLLPRGAQPRMQQLIRLNQLELLRFFPLDVPHVDGLPLSAETTSDVPFSNHTHLATAFDQTKHQVETILISLKPDFILFDFAFWAPALARHLGIKSVYYSVVCAAAYALWLDPSRNSFGKNRTVDELLQLPPGYPSSKVRLRTHDHEVSQLLVLGQPFGSGLTLYERIFTAVNECDAVGMRTCPQIEGRFCEYIAQQFGKPVLQTGTVLPESTQVEEKPVQEEKWTNWLSKFKPGSVVFCALGSQIVLEKAQFQELLLGFELAQQPFLVVLAPPERCTTVNEALPEGFVERVEGKGWVHGGWVPQPVILRHPSIGCFVSHCGPGAMWESLVNDCQIVLVPHLADQILNTRIMVEELMVAVEVERAEKGWVTKENLSKAIKSVMEDSEFATSVRRNHVKWKDVILSQDIQSGGYIDSFIQSIQKLPE